MVLYIYVESHREVILKYKALDMWKYNGVRYRTICIIEIMLAMIDLIKQEDQGDDEDSFRDELLKLNFKDLILHMNDMHVYKRYV